MNRVSVTVGRAELRQSLLAKRHQHFEKPAVDLEHPSAARLESDGRERAERRGCCDGVHEGTTMLGGEMRIAR
jgi:hypothetical protein